MSASKSEVQRGWGILFLLVFVVAERKQRRRKKGGEGGQQDKGQTGKRSYKMNKSTGNTALEGKSMAGRWKEADNENDNEVGIGIGMAGRWKEGEGLLSLPKHHNGGGDGGGGLLVHNTLFSAPFLGMLVWVVCGKPSAKQQHHHTQGRAGGLWKTETVKKEDGRKKMKER